MKKLLQINVCLNLSTGKIAQAIGEKAIAHDWESWIAYSGRMPLVPSKSHVIKVGSKIDPYIHYACNRVFDLEGRASWFATKELICKIKEIQPDVVQLHNIHDHYLNYPLLFRYLNETDIKVVWTFHDCWAFTGHCYHFVEANCMKWQTECEDCPQKGRFQDRSRENFNLKKSLFTGNKNLTIVPCSDWMAGFVKESFLKDKRIEVIKNGVDLGTFRPVEKVENVNEGKRRFGILAVSNVWHQSKGLYDIFKLREILSENDYKITMVGLTADQLKTLPAGIKGIQRTQNVQELVQLYAKSDVLINPTYADTFPTVNLEALACGTPVITYKTGGSPEAIDEKTGLVVEQGNVTAMANAIMLMRDKPLKSEDCRKRAEELFDKDKCFEKYIELYEELIRKD